MSKCTLNKQKGNVALEYVIVSAFGIAAATVALAFAGKIFERKMEQFGDQIGVESEETDWDELVNGDTP